MMIAKTFSAHVATFVPNVCMQVYVMSNAVIGLNAANNNVLCQLSITLVMW